MPIEPSTRVAETAADKLAEILRLWIRDRMAGYTDAQYGKGELREALAAYEREKAGQARYLTPISVVCKECGKPAIVTLSAEVMLSMTGALSTCHELL